MKQPWAWVGWLLAILIILVLILLCILFVGLALRQSGSEMPGPFSIWKLAGWIILLATLFNAFTSHYGATLLFNVPGKIPLISGPITLEAIVYGAINGLVLTGMLASFTVLNLALPMRDLISLIPRAFFPMAVVTSIAVTYLPTTLRQFRLIREAQAVRGHQMRSVKDWLPLLMPLLVGGLEHAMQLAEAMTARGFASVRSSSEKSQLIPRLLMLIGLLFLAIGWITQLGGVRTIGEIVIFAGAGFILGSLWFIGRHSPRTTYHRRSWNWRDWSGLIVAIVVLVMSFFPFGIELNKTLSYDPYPVLSLPPFNLVLGSAMLGFLMPGIFVLKLNSKARPRRDSLKEGAQ
jgi:energy-coupling factor transport system permease protein